jgi:hypothetical protein
MSGLGIAFIAALAVLFIAQRKRGDRLRLFSLVNVPLAFAAYLMLTIMLWKILAPPPVADSHSYALLAIAETAIAVTALGYVITSMVLRR